MTKRLAILAALVFLAGLLVLVINTLLFFRVTFPEAAFPVAEFDANTPRVVNIDDADYGYQVYALVESHGDPSPETTVSVTDADGRPIATTSTTGYADLIGRHYTRLAAFEVADTRPVTITIESGPLEDFAVFHNINDVLDRRSAGATPGWIAGFVLLLAAIGLLVAAMMKSEKSLDRQVSAGGH